MGGRVGIEATTSGLEVRNGAYKRFTIQLPTGISVTAYAQLCATDSRKTHASHFRYGPNEWFDLR